MILNLRIWTCAAVVLSAAFVVSCSKNYVQAPEPDGKRVVRTPDRSRADATTMGKKEEGEHAKPSGARVNDSPVSEMNVDDPRRYNPNFNTEAYDHIDENPFLAVGQNPLSTFSVDVDTASYSNMRRFLSQGRLPPKDSVRVEELINYFTYDYKQPDGKDPFSITTEMTECPWKPGHKLVLVGLQGKRIEKADMPPRNLVFLIDVSGSMNEPNKLPLVKQALRMLVNELTEKDHVSLVVYAGAAGLVLPPTNGSKKEAIIAALDRLEAGGSTNGGEGIQLAYKTAREHLRKGGVNRVILASDGDMNVGITSQGDLIRLIEQERESGVFLTVLGFGMGNYKDSTMEKLANKGNGNYAYIDTAFEAKKVLVHEAGANLVTIAKDVKIQVEFNPAVVQAYRLIGYENRKLRNEDFNDDKKDAGEIGAGHAVTALYEIVPHGVKMDLPGVDPLKYQLPKGEGAKSGELLTVKFRYKEPDGSTSKLIVRALDNRPVEWIQASANMKFATSVAAFGMLLRGSEHKGTASYPMVLALAEQGRGQDDRGYRAEFIRLVHMAKELK